MTISLLFLSCGQFQQADRIRSLDEVAGIWKRADSTVIKDSLGDTTGFRFDTTTFVISTDSLQHDSCWRVLDTLQHPVSTGCVRKYGWIDPDSTYQNYDHHFVVTAWIDSGGLENPELFIFDSLYGDTPHDTLRMSRIVHDSLIDRPGANVTHFNETPKVIRMYVLSKDTA
jgi:hypothetical protein